MQVVRLVIAVLLAGISSGYANCAPEALPSKSFLDGVPYTKQMPNYCGPASLSSLLAYWHVSTDQKDIGCRVYNNVGRGTNAGDLLMYCRDNGLSAYSFNGTLADLKRCISKGYPVIVLQNISRTDTTGHFRVAVGYDDKGKSITLRDSLDTGLVKLQYDDFSKLWDKRGCWAMLVMPPDKDVFRKTLGEGNAVLHMDLAQAYLHIGKYDLAEHESIEALSIEPTNPYAKDLLTKARTHDPTRM